MNSKELKVILLSTGGQIIEFYDFVVFAYFADIISAHYFAGSIYARYMYLFAVFAIGYIVRPLGGVVFGHFGDRVGRKKAFFTAIFMISFATVLMGGIPGYKVWGITSSVIFVILRIIQGFSMGGEMPGAGTFVYESMPKNKKIFGTSFIYSAVFLGAFIAAAVGVFIYKNNHSVFVEKDILWRIPFIVGGLLGFAIGMFRFGLMETPVFKSIQNSKQVLRFPIVELIKKSPKAICRGILVQFFGFFASFIFIVLPNLITKFTGYYDAQNVFIVNLCCIVFLVCIIPLYGYLFDRIKANKYLVLFVASFMLSIVAVPVFTLIMSGKIELLVLAYVITALIYGAAISVTLPVIMSLFPPVIRYSGAGAAINLCAIFTSGLVPGISTFIIHTYGSFYILGIFIALLCFVTSVTGLWLYFRPPNRKRLADINKNVKNLYKMLNTLPIDHDIKISLKESISKHAEDKKQSEEPVLSNHRYISHDDTDFDKAGDFIKEYTKKVMNAETERERMILSRLMHYEYDAVVYGKPVSESLKKHIEEEVDLNLKKINK